MYLASRIMGQVKKRTVRWLIFAFTVDFKSTVRCIRNALFGGTFPPIRVFSVHELDGDFPDFCTAYAAGVTGP